MKVIFATYQSIMMLKGGPRTQILETKYALENLGIGVELFDMWKSYGKQEADIIHIFGSGIATYHFAREVRKSGKTFVVSPIFFSRHSSNFLKLSLHVDELFIKKINGLWTDYRLVSDMCNWADGVIPNTSEEAKLLVEGLKIPHDKVTVVPNGVNKNFVNANPFLFEKTYGIKNFILNVGHIGPGRKNVYRLVRALRKIDKPAVIIGRMENGAELEKIKKAAGNRILLLDNIPNDSEMLASAYAACDVFVLPSIFETPGIAALEAGLAGAKIVITKYGGTREYFKNHAAYVEPTSVDSIADGILRAIEKPKNDNLRKHILENYLWEKVGEKTLSVYKNILKR